MTSRTAPPDQITDANWALLTLIARYRALTVELLMQLSHEETSREALRVRLARLLKQQWLAKTLLKGQEACYALGPRAQRLLGMRITYDQLQAMPMKGRYFYLRPEPWLTVGSVAKCLALCFIQLILATMALVAMCILPVSWWMVTRVYLPALVLLAAPWIARVGKIPLGVFVVLGCIAVFIVVSHPGQHDSVPQTLVGLFAVAFAAPWLVWLLSVIRPEAGRRGTLIAAALLAASLLLATEEVPPPRTLVASLELPLLLVFCMLLVKAYAGRLAADPDVPTEAVYELVRLSRSPWPVRNGARLPDRRWCGAFLASCWSAWGVYQLLCFPVDAEGLLAKDLEDLLHSPLAAAQAASLVVCCVAFGRSPLSLMYHATTGLAASLLLWWSDDDAPAGCDCAPRWRIAGFSVRSVLTIVLFVAAGLAVVLQQPSPGWPSFVEFQRHASWGEALPCALEVIGAGATLVAVTAGTICGPWFLYIADLQWVARKNLELISQEE